MIRRKLLLTTLGIFAAGLLAFLYAFFVTPWGAAARITSGELTGDVALVTPVATPLAEATATPESASPASQAMPAAAPEPANDDEEDTLTWNHKGRLNVLLLGIDQNDCDASPWRTDTMIVASLDPDSGSASLLSLPRDLWVVIPGYGENRLNVAFALGGPPLARRTIQYNFGIPIHHYTTINFQGFRKMIDTLGGIDVNVEHSLYDSAYPDDHCGYQIVRFKPGMQHLDGARALQYARLRHGSSDFERARRQQQVLLAIRQRALSVGVLPKLPTLLINMSDMVQTDFAVRDVLALVPLAAQVRSENIKHAIVDETMTREWTTPAGADVLLPDRARIGRLVRELFGTATIASSR